jgi:hypothetical protein
MPRGKASHDPAMLAMALVGYEIEKKKIDEQIKAIRAQLGGAGPAPKVGRPAKSVAPAEEPKRRKLSVAARKRIAAAQKRRWAEHRKAQAAVAKEESKK